MRPQLTPFTVARVVTAALALAGLAIAPACGGRAPVEGGPVEGRIREKLLPEEGLVRQSIDLDRDGRPDILNFYREREDGPRQLVRKELDLNRDGKIDVVSNFDENGNLDREQMDSDHDGNLDWTDHYQGGIRVLSEYDTDFDGKPNVFKYYTVGADKVAVLQRKERDSDGDGLIDVWERFDEQGVPIRTGRDLDGDGKMDVREE